METKEENLKTFAQPSSSNKYAKEGLILLTYRSINLSMEKYLAW